MERTGKIVAWLCIFSTLLMGCYSSAIIDPTGDEKDEIYSQKIEYVVTKDGTKYQFRRPPTIVKDAIVGEVDMGVGDALAARQVSIPTFDVAQTGKSHSGDITYVVTKAGAKYVFEEPPAVVENSVVGKAKLTERAKVSKVHKEEVSIPLSEVAEIKSVQAGGIEYVVTKGGVKYTFERPPAIVNKTIVGEAQLAEGQLIVTIPLSDVAKVGVSQIDTVGTLVFIIAASASGIFLAVIYALSQIGK